MIGIDTSFMLAFEYAGHESHDLVRRAAARHQHELLAIAPQVISEFTHVATDPRRFEKPLELQDALDRAAAWWDAGETVLVYPGNAALALFQSWMLQYDLGRKRVLNTMLAATYREAGISVIAAIDDRGFSLFPGMHVLPLS